MATPVEPRRRSAQLVVDMAFFAPLGLLVSAAEALPQLAKKGRERVVPQLGLAHTVGEFAVRQGYHRVAGLAGDLGPAGILEMVAAAGKRAAGLAGGPGRSVARPSASPASHGRGERTGNPASSGRRSAPEPSSAHLAIPSYDSLSAPQVVERLAGLSREEVEAVRRYEAATRSRRTILARAEQLLS